MPTRYIISVRKVHLVDHHQVILLDPSSPSGYEMKHAALHEGGDYLNSVDAFEAMLKKIAESTDPSIQGGAFCINKSDHTVLQEALVAMFKWYRASALMVVFLRCSFFITARRSHEERLEHLRLDAPRISRVQDRPLLYRGLDALSQSAGAEPQKSPGVISEMEEATGVSAQQLMALRSAFGRSYVTLRPGRRRRWKMLHAHCWVFSQLPVYRHCTVKGGVRWDIYWHMSLPDLEKCASLHGLESPAHSTVAYLPISRHSMDQQYPIS